MSKTVKVLLGCGLLVLLALLLAALLGGGMLAWFSFSPAASGPVLVAGDTMAQAIGPDALVYWRDDKIMLLPAPGAAEIELGSGQSPVLNGNTVAWIDNETVVLRDIAVAEAVTTMQSPSGKPLALAVDGPLVAWVALGEDGSGILQLVTPEYNPQYRHQGMLFAPAWHPDGQSLVVHDMQNLIRVDLDGKVLATTPLVTFTGNSEAITSSDVYRYCPTDSGLLVFTRAVPSSPAQLVAHNGEPNTAVFLYDFRTRRATRLTGENILGMNPQWTADGTKIRFTGYPDTDMAGNPFRVYEMQRDGSGLRELVRGEIS